MGDVPADPHWDVHAAVLGDLGDDLPRLVVAREPRLGRAHHVVHSATHLLGLGLAVGAGEVEDGADRTRCVLGEEGGEGCAVLVNVVVTPVVVIIMLL